ncbi:MAG: hypothetical protein ICV72_04600 [Aldersonia sp.]|nr:hypothetical protein [Aldersonia sp.]
MDTVWAVLLLITAVVTIGYWVVFFLHGAVIVVQEDWYMRFERAFPVADGFMAASSAVAAIGLLMDEPFGVAFSLVAAGALIFLGLMDVTFNVDNGLYRYVTKSWPMRAEVVIDVWSLGLGVALLVAMVSRVA